MARKYKCYGYCSKTYEKDDMVVLGNFRHCKKCAEIKEKEQKDRDLLYKTIQTVYKIPFPTGQMLKQIKEFKDERNYTYEGMTKTICYFVKILRLYPNLNAGLSFIPYRYDAALKYYNDQASKMEKTGEIKQEIVTIKISPIKHETESIKSKKIIDMGGII